MTMAKTLLATLLLLLLGAALLVGCGASGDAAGEGGAAGLGKADGARRPGFAAWAASLPREPVTGFVIVDQDLVVAGGEAELRGYYEREVAGARARALTVDVVGRFDDVWPGALSRGLAYCVSDTLGADKAAVVAALHAASASWEAAADVRFLYLSAEDDRCTARNTNVVFDVRPSTSRRYLARSFFPKDERRYRSLMVTRAALAANGPRTLAGMLRHELGHVLGLRHEHTRPESGACWEDANWRPVTPYDRASIMHYPQCNGTGDWNRTLTAYDAAGIASLYGPPVGQRSLRGR